MSRAIWPTFTPDTIDAPATAEYEPTDADLASNGITTYPSDPGNSPSYDTLTSTKGPTK